MSHGQKYFATYREAQYAATTLARELNQSVTVSQDQNGWFITPAGQPRQRLTEHNHGGVASLQSRSQVEDLTRQNEKLRTQGLLATEKINELSRQVSDLTKENAALDQSLRDRNVEIERLRETPNEIRLAVDRLRTERDTLLRDIDALTGDLDELGDTKISLRQEIDTLVDEKAATIKQIGFEKKQLTTLQNAVKAAYASLESSQTEKQTDEVQKTFDTCPACGGDGGVRGGCYKCDGTGWM